MSSSGQVTAQSTCWGVRQPCILHISCIWLGSRLAHIGASPPINVSTMLASHQVMSTGREIFFRPTTEAHFSLLQTRYFVFPSDTRESFSFVSFPFLFFSHLQATCAIFSLRSPVDICNLLTFAIKMLQRQERAERTGRGTRGRARDVRGRRGTTPEQHQQPTHLDDDDEPNEGVSILDPEGESGNESDNFQETLDEQLAFHHSPPRMPGQLGEPSQTTAGMDTATSVNTHKHSMTAPFDVRRWIRCSSREFGRLKNVMVTLPEKHNQYE